MIHPTASHRGQKLVNVSTLKNRAKAKRKRLPQLLKAIRRASRFPTPAGRSRSRGFRELGRLRGGRRDSPKEAIAKLVPKREAMRQSDLLRAQEPENFGMSDWFGKNSLTRFKHGGIWAILKRLGWSQRDSGNPAPRSSLFVWGA